ncbi:MAG TPA: folate-binding protein [Xanthobacteraceae bacterium]|nr:folate-binding protein [Xanthobacteraceae bacterium]
MKAALLPDRGVVKVVGDDARTFLNGLLTTDVGTVSPENARFAALLTPQGKIVVDCIVAEALAADGGGFFIDCPRALAPAFATKLNFYKLRAKVMVEDLTEILGVLAVWDGAGTSEYGLCYADPRLPALGMRIMLPPHLAADAAADLGATLVDASEYEAHRIALGVPRGGSDFIYSDAFPHEADMDQLGGIDFEKGCYIGQEVVSRMQHRGTARTRIVAAHYDGAAPETGVAVMAGEKSLGTFGSAAAGHGIALLRLDRVADALAAGRTIAAGGVPLRVVKPAWATFDFTSEAKTAE